MGLRLGYNFWKKLFRGKKNESFEFIVYGRDFGTNKGGFLRSVCVC